MRERGYYWIKMSATDQWEVAFYENQPVGNSYWITCDLNEELVAEYEIFQIDARRIIRHDDKPVYNPQPLTKDWIEFDPSRGYQKQMQDIRLKNGDEVMKCWPNAMVWVTMLPGKYYNIDIPVQDASHVRLTHDENWNR